MTTTNNAPYRERLLSGGTPMPRYSLKVFLICFTLVAIGAGLVACVLTGATAELNISTRSQGALFGLGVVLITMGIVYPMPNSWHPALLVLCFALMAAVIGARLLDILPDTF
jgi:hypothetical protein